MHRLLTSLGLIAAFGIAGGAQALSTTGLEWIKTGGNGTALDVSTETCATAGVIRPALQAAGNACAANVLLTVDSKGISAIGVSFEFDTDMGNEADFVGGFEGSVSAALSGKGNGFSYGSIGLVYVPASNPTRVRLFDMSATPPPAGIGVTTTNSGGMAVTLGTIAFTYNTANVTTDGDDVQVGFFDAGFDGAGTSNNVLVGLNFGPHLQLDAPEPSAALLGVAALGTLVTLRRARRR